MMYGEELSPEAQCPNCGSYKTQKEHKSSLGYGKRKQYVCMNCYNVFQSEYTPQQIRGFNESVASEVQVKPTNDYFNFEDRGDGLWGWDATCQICGETLTTGFEHDLYDHMVENHNDVFHGIASEGRYLIFGGKDNSYFEVKETTDDLELAKAIANDASAEEITVSQNSTIPERGELKGRILDYNTGEVIYSAESKADEDVKDEDWFKKYQRNVDSDKIKISDLWKDEEDGEESKATEGGFGSGKRGHSSWMKDIEFGGNYKKCPLCNINTNFTNGKCEICGNSFAGEKKKANEYGDPLVGSWDEGGWFFGIPNMTRDDYEGGVYWKGKRVEHFDHDYFGYNDDNDDWVNKMREDAKKLERKILELEAKNIPVNMTTVLG